MDRRASSPATQWQPAVPDDIGPAAAEATAMSIETGAQVPGTVPDEPRHSQAWPIPSGLIARLSLEHKLPLLIGALLLVIITALSVAAYAEVRSASFRGASERLVTVTAQFRDLFEQSASQLRSQATTIARNPAVVAFVRSPSPRTRVAALAALTPNGAQASQVVATEIRDSSDAVLLSTPPPGKLRVDTISTRDVRPTAALADSAVIGAYRLVNDTLVYPIAIAVAGPVNEYVVLWRRVARSRQTRETMTQLIGSESEMFIGSPSGGYWTNLENVVAAPRIDFASEHVVQEYTHASGGDRYLAAGMKVAGTPWLLAIGFPVRGIMAPVDNFVERISLIAALALALGLLAAWIASRRITRPLLQLTTAADAIAHGNFAQRVRVRRSDELGRLGSAFAIMAGELQLAREDLERKVDERTRDLNSALHQLNEAQESLVRRERLALLGQLSGSVGHELRNPLGVMTNAVYYLKAVLGQSTPTVHEYLEILQQQIGLSEKIVNDLLEFARSKPPSRRSVSVADEIHAQVARLGASPSIRIETSIPAQLPLVMVDQTQFGQIMFNLLTNAMQAIDREGTIVIRAESEGDHVSIDVADTGPGIAREDIERVFEPLFTTKARGIGLGLAVCRTLARANEGDLTATSTPGEGATFRLTLQSGPPGHT